MTDKIDWQAFADATIDILVKPAVGDTVLIITDTEDQTELPVTCLKAALRAGADAQLLVKQHIDRKALSTPGPVLSERQNDSKEFQTPTNCPECGTAVVKPAEEAMHRCPNTSCPAQFFELLKHFVSKSAINIDGLGEQWCRILVDQGLVTDLAELYSLKKDQLLQLDRMGQKLAGKIIDNIEDSKDKPLAKLIFALGIVHVGSEVAEMLTQVYAKIEELADATIEELSRIPGIGPKIATSIVSYFQVEANKAVIDKLRAAGVNTKQEPPITTVIERPLSGKTFVVTGTLLKFSRNESESKIKDLGGKVTSSVTQNTDYLVVGQSPGSKLSTAERLGTEILDEDEFVELLANPFVDKTD